MGFVVINPTLRSAAVPSNNSSNLPGQHVTDEADVSACDAFVCTTPHELQRSETG